VVEHERLAWHLESVWAIAYEATEDTENTERRTRVVPRLRSLGELCAINHQGIGRLRNFIEQEGAENAELVI
jgi:hypothetical protein